MRILAWTLQILILSAGIHLFLRFVRNTRGSRLIRGLFVSVSLGVFLLWGLSRSLELEELEHILKGAAGLIVIVFAIVFQPELRRGIAQLGEHSFVGRLVKSSASDTLQKVVRAAQSMARERCGALIAFERRTSLNTYVETGTPIDARITTRLIQSLFQSKSPLHDGAVVIREDRILAAGCFFPLPQEGDIDRSLGTRHRAALGVSEETDAVVLVVSEETGSISLAKGGQIFTALSDDQVETQLKELLESTEKSAGPKSAEKPKSPEGARFDFFSLAASILLACGILFLAYQDIRITRKFSVQVAGTEPSLGREPENGELLVLLSQDNQRLVAPTRDQQHKVEVTGSRAQIDALGGFLRGVFELSDPDWSGGPIAISEVEWQSAEPGLGFRWGDSGSPELQVERFDTVRHPLSADNVRLDESGLNPRFEVKHEEIALTPPTLDVSGPSKILAQLGESLPLKFEEIRLAESDRGEREFEVGLDLALVEQGFRLERKVHVTIPIIPAQREVGLITREVALVCMAPDRVEELDRWLLPAHAQTARFRVQSSGLIPVNADPGSPALLERLSSIRRFVEENLLVFVDIAELPPAGEGRSLEIRWTWRRDWREALEDFGIDSATLGRYEDLQVLLESEPEILLEVREQPEDSLQSGSQE